MNVIKNASVLENAITLVKQTLRIAAIGDIHCTQTSQGAFKLLFSQINENADVLLLCGDLTSYGLLDEARILAMELNAALKIPILAVLGNHDHESGKSDEIRKLLADAGVIMLDGDHYEIQGIGFAGVKGFAGGFDDKSLQSWGEKIIKRFVLEAVNEALKLESALSRLRTSQRIVLLHYAPIVSTIKGEPCEIYPFLGSSRLEEPLIRYSVSAVFHSHAHNGSPQGHTRNGVQVYNVAMPLLERVFPDQPPFRLLEIPVDPDTKKGA